MASGLEHKRRHPWPPRAQAPSTLLTSTIVTSAGPPLASAAPRRSPGVAARSGWREEKRLVLQIRDGRSPEVALWPRRIGRKRRYRWRHQRLGGGWRQRQWPAARGAAAVTVNLLGRKKGIGAWGWTSWWVVRLMFFGCTHESFFYLEKSTYETLSALPSGLGAI